MDNDIQKELTKISIQLAVITEQQSRMRQDISGFKNLYHLFTDLDKRVSLLDADNSRQQEDINETKTWVKENWLTLTNLASIAAVFTKTAGLW